MRANHREKPPGQFQFGFSVGHPGYVASSAIGSYRLVLMAVQGDWQELMSLWVLWRLPDQRLIGSCPNTGTGFLLINPQFLEAVLSSYACF